MDAAAFVRQTRHFFQTIDGNRWSFFHNSFRQYLIRRTSEDLLGNYSEVKNRAQHLRLAELAQLSERRSAFEREVIYHLYEAGEFGRVLDQATQSIFREQFFDLRSFRQIADDIGLMVRSAKNELSGLGLLRAWLIDKELHEREYCLEISSFRSSIDAFLDTESLLSSIIDHSGLLVSRAQAMTCARRLLEAGLEQASRRVFDLAEPLDLLSGIEKSKPREGDQEFLEDWYFYRAAAKEYFECLVLAVAAHGPAQLESLGREFDAVWDAHESRSTWTADLRRSIAVALFRSGDGKDRLVARLERIAESETLPDDLQERLESLIETARMWQLAGEPARAKALLAPTIKASFGIHHHKDRQFQTWISWLDKASAEGATDIIADCNQFASALRAIVDLGRGRGSQEAASHLLSIATRASPAFALQLRESLFQTGTVSYGAACQGFIEGVLGRDDCDPLAVVDFLANVGAGAELPSVEGVLPKLVQALVRRSAPATVRPTLEPLVASVLVDEFESQRGAWLRLLHREVQKFEIAWPELATLADGCPEIEGGTPMKVKLRDGSEILERDFRRQIVDFASLKTAIQLSEPQSFYGWDRATEVVVRSASLEQLEALIPQIDLLGSRAHLVAAQIVDRLAEIGSGRLAQGLAERYQAR